MESKLCTGCNKLKTLEEFYINTSRYGKKYLSKELFLQLCKEVSRKKKK